MAAARFVVSFILASFVTFGLFYLMQSLIGVEGTLDESEKVKVVDFVRVERSEEVKEKKRKVPERRKLDDTPPPPDINLESTPNLSGDGISIGAAVEGGVSLSDTGGLNLASADGDAVPMVRVPPQYPERAAQRGIEGRVLIEFTISRGGTVKDAKVIAAEPNAIFNKAALKAVSQWKYNPKVENGKAIEQRGVRVAIPFKLEGQSG